MGRKEKLEKRLLSKPKDLTYEEVVSLLSYYGITQDKAGKTGGSRVRFSSDDGSIVITFHRPHHPGTFKRYMIDQLIATLRQEGFLK